MTKEVFNLNLVKEIKNNFLKEGIIVDVEIVGDLKEEEEITVIVDGKDYFVCNTYFNQVLRVEGNIEQSDLDSYLKLVQKSY
jgi:hypothetical protein